MIKNLLLLSGFFIVAQCNLFAQKQCTPAVTAIYAGETLNQSEKEANSSVSEFEPHPYGGTFQIITKKGTNEVFTTDLIKLIEAKRLENKQEVIVLSAYTKVKILSKKQISSPHFEPIKYLYSFE